MWALHRRPPPVWDGSRQGVVACEADCETYAIMFRISSEVKEPRTAREVHSFSRGMSGVRVKQSGFTLIEVMIVVAIIGVLGALAGSLMTRSRERANLNAAGSLLKSRLELSRSLAIGLASRFGTPQVTDDGSCLMGGNGLFMTFNVGAGTYNLPTQVTDNGDGTSTVSCTTFDVADDSTDRAELDPSSVVPPLGVTFTPSGRLVNAGGQPAELFVLLRNPQVNQEQYGVRVLSSGILCRSFDPAPGECDAEANP